MSAPNDKEESFITHLVEMRNRLVKAFGAVLVIFLGLMLYPGANAIYDFLAAPMMNSLPAGTKMIATNVISPFLTPMKVALMAAFMVGLPFVLYQAWAFIAPGLYEHEKRLAMPVIISATILFFAGVAFCYYFVFGNVFKFIQEFAPKAITAAPDIDQYLSFVMSMFIAFGLTFEIPIVVVLLVLFGMVKVEKLAEVRGYVIVGAFVVAAIVTPPDVISQLMLAIPMCLLYEVGILAAKLVRKRRPAGDAQTTTE